MKRCAYRIRIESVVGWMGSEKALIYRRLGVGRALLLGHRGQSDDQKWLTWAKALQCPHGYSLFKPLLVIIRFDSSPVKLY